MLTRCSINLSDCKSQYTIKDGTIEYLNTTYNSLATVKCKTGYAIQGRPYLICQANGTWNEDTACKPVGKYKFSKAQFREAQHEGNLLQYSEPSGHMASIPRHDVAATLIRSYLSVCAR